MLRSTAAVLHSVLFSMVCSGSAGSTADTALLQCSCSACWHMGDKALVQVENVSAIETFQNSN
jgi:hypothetical protein